MNEERFVSSSVAVFRTCVRGTFLVARDPRRTHNLFAVHCSAKPTPNLRHWAEANKRRPGGSRTDFQSHLFNRLGQVRGWAAGVISLTISQLDHFNGQFSLILFHNLHLITMVPLIRFLDRNGTLDFSEKIYFGIRQKHHDQCIFDFKTSYRLIFENLFG
ncbi:hypothetical protein AVEN_274394-1 [Araneus ventricosus]|uniref:Uncharacterized protein n=1 Tax=Araneus ventricosus TaxID=182803 RepID=A0A4Y2T6U0_ARAVE|nr:hypothetical protein AVEN_274394-1 [Araneus ventricosus]